MTEKKSGFIYVIEDSPKICKIGFTKRAITTRCKQISQGFHKDFSIRGFFKSEDYEADEKTIHLILRNHRIRGEWFSLSYEEIKEKLASLFQFSEAQNLEPSNEPVNISLRIPKSVLAKIDERLGDFFGLSRNAWICLAIQKEIENGKKY